MNINIKHKIVLLFIFFLPLLSFAQKRVTVSGYISDSATGEQLPGATLFFPKRQTGVSCNQYGFYSITVPEGKTTAIYRYVGYTSKQLLFRLNRDTTINIKLATNNNIDEVKIKALSNEEFLLSPTMGMQRLSAKQVEQIPVVLGEPDLLKAIQMLPGVSFSSESSTGFSVRGGSPDQTLIQLDGVPVYNASHLWGFMSVFNNDAISETKLYKGNLPARFGGRLSSVLDIRMKEGNMKKISGVFSISPIASRFTLEGPILKNKMSFMVSARKTWADVILLTAQKLYDTEKVVTYGFWDISAKVNWKINHNNRLFLSFYTGRDAFWAEELVGIQAYDYSKFTYNWQNLTTVLRWNHIFSPTLFANFSAYNSRFKQEYLNKYDRKGEKEYKGYNNLTDWTVKGNFDWFPLTNIRTKFGFNLSNQIFSPEIISFKSPEESFVLNSDIFTQNLISELYFESNINITQKIKGNFGLRGGIMSTQGKKYWSLRPRVSLRYSISDFVSGKISYSRMTQFLHQLKNTSLGIPTELWVSSTDKIRPGTSDLFSAGIFWKPTPKYHFSAETYYSLLHNVIRYKPESLGIKEQGNSWENYIVQGEGKSYGIEFMAEKKTGKLTGWVSYTLSKSTRQFDEINFGNLFPYSYERRHQFKIISNYNVLEKIKKSKNIKHSISASFIFASGAFITLAEQEYSGISFPVMDETTTSNWFEKRSLVNTVNNYRMPPFHRLNLSYTIERKHKNKTILWNFSLYNAYNRHNPWYYYKKGTKIKQVTMFPIIPSISFTYKW